MFRAGDNGGVQPPGGASAEQVFAALAVTGAAVWAYSTYKK